MERGYKEVITCSDTDLFEQAKGTAKKYFDAAYEHLYATQPIEDDDEILVKYAMQLAEIMASDCNAMVLAKRMDSLVSALFAIAESLKKTEE